ncbi:HEAT repeat domain-containing protein [Marinicella meishanensis]|uniref:HEAT repeat domain-containing protein n=1 Tax=Marinicella meishanensis TaxID=2873263 RepID=UPI001CC15D73|nr:hypothetical protein [Marinicella sp. NBU2979]
MDFYQRFKTQAEILQQNKWYMSDQLVKDKIKALEYIGLHGQPTDVPHLMRYVSDTKNKAIRSAAAQTIATLLDDQTKPVDWLRLYHGCHFSYEFDAKQSLHKLTGFPADQAAHLFGLMTLHRDGFIREAALQRLKQCQSDNALPYILMRLNDWVPQVQKIARDMFLQCLPALSLQQLTRRHDLFAWLARSTRHDLTHVTQQVTAHMGRTEHRGALLDILIAGPYHERLFCLKHMPQNINRLSELIGVALQDPAPEIRQWGARKLPQDALFVPRIKKLLKDKATRVRIAALRRIPENHWPDYTDVLKLAVFDGCRSIRESARFALKHIGVFADNNDLAALYRQRLHSEQPITVGIIAGLGETGTIDDSKLLTGYLSDSRSKIRAAALLALQQINATGMEARLINGLKDVGKVRKLCSAILIEHPPKDLDALIAVSEQGSSGSRKEAFKVLHSLGGLEALKYILIFILDEDPDLADFAAVYYDHWFEKFGTMPWFIHNKETWQEVMDVWDKLNHKIPDYHPGMDRLLRSLG